MTNTLSENATQSAEPEDSLDLSDKESSVLLAAVFVVAMCGIVYELIIATVSSYLLGDSVYQFSMTIGLFMFAMGIGSYLTQRFRSGLLPTFIAVEIAIALAGGLSGILLFVAFPYPALYSFAMYGLILLVGTLVGLEIPILTRLLTNSTGIRRALANVLSLDYLGALIGSVGFPLLLFPTLGLFSSSFAVGLVNILIAIITVVVFRKRLANYQLFLGSAIFVVTLLIASLICSETISRYAEGQLFADRILLKEQTPYQRIVLTRSDRNSELRLYIDGHLQFSSKDEYRYHEALVHPVMSLPGEVKKVLILGGGDGLAIREVLKYPEVEQIDLVDIDPAITRICSETAPIATLNNNSLKDPKVHIHNVDAFSFLLQEGILYDRAILDLPDPHNEALNKLYSVEFYRMLAHRMSQEGAFVTQATSPFYAREACWCIADTIKAAGENESNIEQVRSYGFTIPSFGMWAFHLASSKGSLDADFSIDESTTEFLTNRSLNQAGIEGKDTAWMRTSVNSMFRPTLYQLYQIGLKR